MRPDDPEHVPLDAEKVGGLLEYNDTPDALKYFQSRGSWPDFD